MKRVILVDGNQVLHASIHALESKGRDEELYRPKAIPDINLSAESVGGAYYFISAVRRIIGRFEPGRCLVVWDGDRSKRRQLICPTYKEGRIPDEKADPLGWDKWNKHQGAFKGARTLLESLLPLLKLRSVCLASAEADDSIFLLTRLITEPIIIASEDKDFLQLVSSNVLLYRQSKDILVTPANFRESSSGIDQGAWLMYRAVVGDDGDGIYGPEGVGEVTVKELIGFCSSVFEQMPVPAEIGLADRAVDYVCRSAKVLAERYKGAKASRFAKVADAGALLSRNLGLLDLRREPCEKADFDYLASQVRGDEQTKLSFNESLIQKEFLRYGFGTLLESWSNWSNPFRMLRG